MSILFSLAGFQLAAEGTPDLRSATGDPVLLLLGEDAFGDFASYDSPATSRLNFRIAKGGETVYFGFARLYNNGGTPERVGQFDYRVRRASDNEIVFGPVRVNSSNENLTTYEEAVAGPSALNPAGYEAADRHTFVAGAAGEYYVEFSRSSRGSARFIGLWDITVADNGTEKPGRVYSRNWAFRVPETDPVAPLCAFGAELNTQFYSYTADGFVTLIDFTDSGFQPLSFNLAFNRTGPGSTGDLIEDRKSVAEQNLTSSSAEHLIFLNEPDAFLFPDGTCGQVNVTRNLQCQANNTFCIPVAVTMPGQVQIVLDFNGNGSFDDETDRILAYRLETGGSLSACVPWDGLLPDGSRPPQGATVDILVEYTQGVQHWALYDGELMTNGFCVTPIRPLCEDPTVAALYYDDSDIPDDPGTGAPQRVLDGCECRTGVCRTWSNFETFATAECQFDNDLTEGYGDRNTLNTWWFATSQSMSSFDVPVEVASISGPIDHCPGTGVDLTLDYLSSNEVASIRWTGPNGALPAGNDQFDLLVNVSGVYRVIVTDEFGCTAEASYTLADVGCTLNIELLGVECNDSGTDTDSSDDVFTARVRVTGDNSDGFSLADGSAGTYGEVIELGPFLITDGPLQFSATDNFYACCTEEISIVPPSACSDGCAITTANILSTDCNDAGTPTDPTDDTFTFDVIIDGINLGDNWTTDRGMSGDYGEVTTFGPFLISEGNQRFVFADAADAGCVMTTTVQPPRSCSNECILEPVATNVMCNDGGTPFDASDDTYTFDLVVNGTNTPSVAFSINGSGVNLYGTTVALGPFRIAGSDFTFDITDAADAGGCNISLTLDNPPATCSDACGIQIDDVIVSCEEIEGANMAYFAEALVSNQNPASTSWIGPGGKRYPYNEYVLLEMIEIGGEAYTFTATDSENADCVAEGSVDAPEFTIDCPEDVSDVAYAFGLQSFGGELSASGNSTGSDRDICWMQEETYSGGRRYFERLTIERSDSSSEGLALFSFYLLAEADTDVLGAVFSSPNGAEIDCCNLTNDGPVTGMPTNLLATPVLADSLITEDLTLHQRFSLLLRPRQIYTLLTSSPTPNTTGEYTWIVVSDRSEALQVTRSTGGDPESEFSEANFTFDLLTTQLPAVENEAGSLVTFGTPTIGDICGNFEVDFTDQLTGTCAGNVMTRSFSLELNGNSLDDVCSQDIRFRALRLTDVIWPESGITFGCGDSFPMLNNLLPDPDYTGHPALYREGRGQPILDGNTDNLTASYRDETTVREDGGTNVVRTWTVRDDCRQETANYSQLIKLESNGKPFFSCPTANHYCPIIEGEIMLFPTERFDCTAEILIPAPELNNICNEDDWVFMTRILRLEPNGDTTLYAVVPEDSDRRISAVAVGEYLIHYRGNHPQETIEDSYCRFRVADTTEPIAVCKSNFNLSLPGSGRIAVPFTVINQGSYDNCGIEVQEVRRRLNDINAIGDSIRWSPWQNRLIFDCEDVGAAITVEMRVTDVGDNVNYCTSRIVIQDNTLPYCTGLEAVTISCDELPNNFSAYDTTQLRQLFGLPEVVDNCSATASELSPLVTGDSCSPERIRRRFRALDQNGNYAAGIFFQDIFVSPSLNYAILFPKDASTNCTDLVDTLRITGAGCDSITFTSSDVELPIVGEECRFIERTFVVTNWCEWDGSSAPLQIGRDENCSGTEGDAATWLVRSAAGIFIDLDSLSTNDLPAAGSICSPGNPEGYVREVTDLPGGRYVYSQRIKIFDTTAPEITLSMLDSVCVDTSACLASLTLDIQLFDACQVEEGQVTVTIDFDNDGTIDLTAADEAAGLTGQFPNYAFAESFPLGEHRMVFDVTDDCSNSSSLERVFTVYDCYVPILVCKDDRLYNLEPLVEVGDIDGDGVVEEAAVLVEAFDLAQCNFPDCSGDLTYSLNRVGEAIDRDQSSLYLDCGDRYQVELEVYVWDEAFNPFSVQPDGTVGGSNWRSCTVRVRLQDPNLACNNCQVENNITVNGNINTMSGMPIRNVTVSGGNAELSSVTNTFGGYQLGGELGDDFTLAASKDVDPRQGLSTIDLVIIRRHLLGQREIDNPFVRLAADLNRDGNISVLDVVHLHSLILARRELYPDGSPWRFVDARWDGTGDPKETISLNGLAGCTFDHDFIGIRLGDLNGSFSEATVASNGGRSRPAAFVGEDMDFLAGETVTVSLSLPQVGGYAGAQTVLEWNTRALALIDLKSSELDPKQNFRVADNYLWMSWADELTEDRVVEMSFQAAISGRLSDHFALVENPQLPSEAYGTDLTPRPLILNWTGAEGQPVAVEVPDLIDPEIEGIVPRMLGVLPNPVQAVTRVGIYVPSAQNSRLVLTDVAGRRTVLNTVDLSKGEQWLRVNAENLVPGVYQLTVELEEGPVTTRIVKQ